MRSLRSRSDSSAGGTWDTCGELTGKRECVSVLTLSRTADTTDWHVEKRPSRCQQLSPDWPCAP